MRNTVKKTGIYKQDRSEKRKRATKKEIFKQSGYWPKNILFA